MGRLSRRCSLGRRHHAPRAALPRPAAARGANGGRCAESGVVSLNPDTLKHCKDALRATSCLHTLAAEAARLPHASLRMSSNEISPSEELVRLTRLAHEAQGLSILVHAQYELRNEMRRALLLQQWSDLESVERELVDSAPLAGRFSENLHHVLERPELSAGEPFGRLHGLVLAIPVAITCKVGTLASLPQPLESAFRESLQERFPGNAAMRLVNRLVPQLVAHGMEARSLYEMIRELASGGERSGGTTRIGTGDRVPPARPQPGSALSVCFGACAASRGPRPVRDLQTDPGLVKWSAAQTEAITSNFAERGWPLLVRVATPQRLGQMLSSPLLLSDVESSTVCSSMWHSGRDARSPRSGRTSPCEEVRRPE